MFSMHDTVPIRVQKHYCHCKLILTIQKQEKSYFSFSFVVEVNKPIFQLL